MQTVPTIIFCTGTVAKRLYVLHVNSQLPSSRNEFHWVQSRYPLSAVTLNWLSARWILYQNITQILNKLRFKNWSLNTSRLFLTACPAPICFAHVRFSWIFAQPECSLFLGENMHCFVTSCGASLASFRVKNLNQRVKENVKETEGKDQKRIKMLYWFKNSNCTFLNISESTKMAH